MAAPPADTSGVQTMDMHEVMRRHAAAVATLPDTDNSLTLWCVVDKKIGTYTIKNGKPRKDAVFLQRLEVANVNQPLNDLGYALMQFKRSRASGKEEDIKKWVRHSDFCKLRVANLDDIKPKHHESFKRLLLTLTIALPFAATSQAASGTDDTNAAAPAAEVAEPTFLSSADGASSSHDTENRAGDGVVFRPQESGEPRRKPNKRRGNTHVAGGELSAAPSAAARNADTEACQHPPFAESNARQAESRANAPRWADMTDDSESEK